MWGCLLFFFAAHCLAASTLLQELEVAVQVYRSNMAQLRVTDIETALVDLARKEAKEGKTYCQLNVAEFLQDWSIAVQATKAFENHWSNLNNGISIRVDPENVIRMCWSNDLNCARFVGHYEAV